MVHYPLLCRNGEDLVIRHVKRDESATFHWKRGCKVVRNIVRTVGATGHSLSLPAPLRTTLPGKSQNDEAHSRSEVVKTPVPLHHA